MKIRHIILSLVFASMLGSGVAFAADAKPAADQSKPAKCCAKAAEAGKSCDHECCAEAAKAGKNCDKCGGAGATDEKK